MNRAEKETCVEAVKERFVNAPFIALTDFKGSTVAQMDTLRRACEDEGVEYAVIKNTLSRIAVVGTDAESLSEYFKGNTGLFFSGDDPIGAAKLLKAQVKENEMLVVKAAFFEGDVLDAAGATAVASLPSREELLTTLLRTLQEGPRQVVGVLQAPSRDLLGVLSNYAAKMSKAAE
jgi:large subunit ribosomal protein L10